jgi:type II secretory pathway component PulC
VCFIDPMHRFALMACFVSLVGCGGNVEAPDPQMPRSPGTAAPTTTAAVGVKITSLKRSEVRAAIGRGVGSFLRNVELDEWPAMMNGKFYGWRIRAVNPEWILDVLPGDVITRINGMPIEHPEEADAALRSLEKAPSLKVDIERNGQPRVFELPITED